MPTEPAIAAPPPQPAGRVRRGRAGARWSGPVVWAAAAVLAALGAWRLIDDLRPVPDLVAVRTMLARGRVAEAERGLRDLLARSPDHGEARQELARLLARRGEVRGAAEQLHRVPAWWPGKRAAQFLEGQAFDQLDLARRAEAAWRGCVADDPLHPVAPDFVNGAAKALVALYVLEGRRDEARAALWGVYPQVAPHERPVVLETLMRAETQRIAPGEAVATLRRHVAADPDDRVSRLALARAEQAAGHPAEADRILDDLLGRDPSAVDAWRARVQVLLDRNDPAALALAVDRLPESVRRADDAAIAIARASVLEARGDLEGALALLRTAARLEPANDEAHYRLSRVALRLGHAAEAEAHRRRHRALQDAQRELPDAMTAYRDLSRGDASGGAERARTVERLAAISETLGWTRLAEAWRKQLVPH
jgi:tetratricopeptide (TPR) repeat protein